MAITPFDGHEWGDCVDMLGDRASLDSQIPGNRKRVLESLLGRLMHTAAALTIISEPDVRNRPSLEDDFAALNFYFSAKILCRPRLCFTEQLLPTVVQGNELSLQFLQIQMDFNGTR